MKKAAICIIAVSILSGCGQKRPPKRFTPEQSKLMVSTDSPRTFLQYDYDCNQKRYDSDSICYEIHKKYLRIRSNCMSETGYSLEMTANADSYKPEYKKTVENFDNCMNARLPK